MHRSIEAPLGALFTVLLALAPSATNTVEKPSTKASARRKARAVAPGGGRSALISWSELPASHVR